MNDLVIKLTGEIQDSNFDEWKAGLIAQIKSANKELVNDDDFAEAEGTVKSFKAAEKSLVEAKESALEQAADIQKLFGAIDEISEEARQARLSLERQIKQRKEEIKSSLINASLLWVDDLIKELKNDFKIVSPNIYQESEFIEAVKGKRTIETMGAALDDLKDDIADRISIELNRLKRCRKIIDGAPGDYKSLFQDERALLAMEPELLQATIDKRIATHEAQEAKRREADAQRKAEEAERLVEQEKEDQPVQSNNHQEPEASNQAVSDLKSPPESKSDQENMSFKITVLLNSTTAKAQDIAQFINNELSGDDDVVQIRLTRTQEAA